MLVCAQPHRPPSFEIHTHRSTTLTRQDVTRHYGIPITTPARTLQDLARVLPSHALTRAVNEARVRNLISNRHYESGPTRSKLEDEFLRFIEKYDLPRPRSTRSSPARRSTCSTEPSA